MQFIINAYDATDDKALERRMAIRPEHKESEVKEIKLLDYDADHYCPVYKNTIGSDLCYESLMALGKMFKTDSVPELNAVNDIDEARDFRIGRKDIWKSL